MTTLSAREAYRLWAPSYAENAVTFLENRLVTSLGPAVDGRRLIDVGCGTGMRLRPARAALAVGVDLSAEMLARAPGDRAVADISALPVATGAFDLVWCRLMLGYVDDLDAAYAELARVCRRGGTVVVTDFHPDAVTAGHRQTVRDPDGARYEILHHVHTPAAQIAAAGRAGLRLVRGRDGKVGPAVESFYRQADRLDAYQAQLKLRIVLALSFARVNGAT
jgi:malonyl-CoA O-methyltransferase